MYYCNVKIWHIYDVEVYDVVQFGADPDNNLDLVEENVGIVGGVNSTECHSSCLWIQFFISEKMNVFFCVAQLT